MTIVKKTTIKIVLPFRKMGWLGNKRPYHASFWERWFGWFVTVRRGVLSDIDSDVARTITHVGVFCRQIFTVRTWYFRPVTAEALLASSKGERRPIIFINDHEFGEGYLAHNYITAAQWCDAEIENLGDGDELTVDFRRRDMTEAEIKAMPEI